MSEKPIRPDVSPSREFVPEVKSLEGRILLSAATPQGDSIVWYHNPPRTGGIAIQSGSVLSCFVGEPRENQVKVVDNGKGNVSMSWNFGHPQVFKGVTTTIVQAQRAGTDQFSFGIGDTVTALGADAGSTFHQPGPSAGSTAVELGSGVPMDAATPGGSGHPLDTVLHRRTGGIAIQSGSLLTVTVDRPRTNVVQITNEGAGNVQVEWNGGPVHSFSGVANIIVDAKNARKDQVTLTDATP
jgi:hypothetical protein